MRSIKYSFAINSYNQAVNIITICQKRKIFPIIYIKYFMINGFGPDWMKEFKNLLEQQFSKKKFKLFVDCKKNYALFINLVEQKIDYLKIDAKEEAYKKLNQIAKKNKVLINPKFSVLDFSKIKNVNLKFKRSFLQ